MGSRLMLIRICQKPLKPFLHPSASGFSALEAFLVPLCLYTKDHPGPGQTSRGNSGQGQLKDTTIRFREKESWGDAVNGTSKRSLFESHSFSKSMFAAGTAKRTAEQQRSREAPNSQGEDTRQLRFKNAVQLPDRPLSFAEWKELLESQGNLEVLAFVTMKRLSILGAELDIAKSLLSFVVMETGKVSYKLLLFYLKMCVDLENHKEVFDVYEIMQGNFSSLETSATSLFIKSFCQTERWREAIGILNNIKKVIRPSSNSYSEIISAAMAHGDLTTAWGFHDEAFEKEMNLRNAWKALFQGVSDMEVEKGKEAQSISQSEHNKRLLGILLYMRSNQIYPEHSLASNIKSWFESLTEQKWTGKWTYATSNGLCSCCGSELESIHLTDEEYERLKYGVMTDIIKGKDVFKKTTPEELEKFKRFVNKTSPYDVVLDGLNIANTHRKKIQPSMELLNVVSELEGHGLKMLMLGRKHMMFSSKKWNTQHMNQIRQKAHCFFTENIG
ncbi:mitochondrial ribonuclease P catalytic subunit isoform X2 [Antennarius striatus]|uniref:mitochondrial ribonuclease P catalytic subunit isoform X2 n=1 Tax=Antennarius striatus TaxID=241820 RepID=UPI0035AF6B30